MGERNINTANTLSINMFPGREKLFPETSKRAIFSHGDFRLEGTPANETIGPLNTGGTFSPYSTLSNLTSDRFNADPIIALRRSELNLDRRHPNTYAYFGSLSVKVGNSILNIMTDFPYGIISYDNNTGTTLHNYSYNSLTNISTFIVPLSSVTNQGNILLTSGSTGTTNVYNNPEEFSVQISGAAESTTLDILTYSYTADSVFSVTVAGNFLGTSTITADTRAIYLRPTTQRYNQYIRSMPVLENQILQSGQFLEPDEDCVDLVLSGFTWPKTIDGFNPDISGAAFSSYTVSLLNSAGRNDDVKSNILIRSLVPENFVDLDSDSRVYKNLMNVFSEEFDKIKQYIDALAYAHSATYSGRESVPNAFLERLGQLLGFTLPDIFNNVDFFEYIAGQVDTSGRSYSDYNIELWRRIIVNISWLYKKKGTRDALMFVFKLLGAPDCLIRFDEFVYKVGQQVKQSIGPQEIFTAQGFDPSTGISGLTASLAGRAGGDTLLTSSAIGVEGYPNIEDNPSIFQEGGAGRGDGQKFISLYDKDYTLEKTVDNKKIFSAVTSANTRNTINTKELSIGLDPAYVVECDVHAWYKLGLGVWWWGIDNACPPSDMSAVTFSSLTVPFEWTLDVDTCFPTRITAMTISEFMDFIYANQVNPRTRKTVAHYDYTSWMYINLKKVYITYMLMGAPFNSNRLTIRKLENLLTVIERGFSQISSQLIPATTIFDGLGTIYRNTGFNREKFVYKPGISAGSEFKKKVPLDLRPNMQVINLTPKVNDIIKDQIVINTIAPTLPNIINPSVVIDAIGASIIDVINPSVATAEIAINVDTGKTQSIQEPILVPTTVIEFPYQ